MKGVRLFMHELTLLLIEHNSRTDYGVAQRDPALPDGQLLFDPGETGIGRKGDISK